MSDLATTHADLLAAARDASRNAHVPYSNFRVGAALRSRDGRVFLGCNVENAAYSMTICAERTALVSAVAAGVSDFDVIAVHVDGAEGSPCGACRQVLAEFGTDMLVVYRTGGAVVARTAGELLPDAFLPAALDA